MAEYRYPVNRNFYFVLRGSYRVKTFITSILALLVITGCATQSSENIKLPPTIPLPPTPVPQVEMKKLSRQSVRAFAASSATVTTTQADTNSPNYGVVGLFPVEHEDGKKTIGVYIQWNNWPSDAPYSVQKSTNLVNWEDVILSNGDNGRVLAIFDPQGHVFYRIVRAFVSGPAQ
jgi:hypothetical protein